MFLLCHHVLAMPPWSCYATMVLLCHHGLAMPPRSCYATMVLLCHHGLAMPLWSCYATMFLLCHHGLAMPPWSCYATMVLLCHHVLNVGVLTSGVCGPNTGRSMNSQIFNQAKISRFSVFFWNHALCFNRGNSDNFVSSIIFIKVWCNALYLLHK